MKIEYGKSEHGHEFPIHNGELLSWNKGIGFNRISSAKVHLSGSNTVSSSWIRHYMGLTWLRIQPSCQ